MARRRAGTLLTLPAALLLQLLLAFHLPTNMNQRPQVNQMSATATAAKPKTKTGTSIVQMSSFASHSSPSCQSHDGQRDKRDSTGMHS